VSVNADEVARIVGERLKRARERKRLTQAAVAEELGLPRTGVVALEQGNRNARPDELVQLAHLYSTSLEELLRPTPPSGELVPQLRSSFERRPEAAEIEEAAHELQTLAEDYFELERLAGAPLPTRFPSLPDTASLGPERAAAHLADEERSRLRLGDGPLPHLREVLETDVGLRVFALRLPWMVAGMFAFDPQLGAVVAINASHSFERQRMSLAHEYAHFLVSRNRPEVTVLLEEYKRVPAGERFADSFSRYFLLPESGVRRRFEAAKASSPEPASAALIVLQADYWRVSVEAMWLRLEELGLVRAGSWERAQLRDFRPQEARQLLGLAPTPPDSEMLPRRYRWLSVDLYQRGELSEGQLARFLRTERLQARRITKQLEEDSTYGRNLADEPG
jgi:Zn-dependent peptidase ImmA (M78 family)/DNA-binding XRE family transcriptional regulator